MSHPLQNNPQVSYETSDLTARGFGRLVALVLGVALVIFLALTGFYNFFRSHDTPTSTPLSPVWQARNVPPLPRLQAAPAEDEAVLRTRQKARLNSYGWTNRAKGQLHVPVERAMELVLHP